MAARKDFFFPTQALRETLKIIIVSGKMHPHTPQKMRSKERCLKRKYQHSEKSKSLSWPKRDTEWKGLHRNLALEDQEGVCDELRARLPHRRILLTRVLLPISSPTGHLSLLSTLPTNVTVFCGPLQLVISGDFIH